MINTADNVRSRKRLRWTQHVVVNEYELQRTIFDKPLEGDVIDANHIAGVDSGIEQYMRDVFSKRHVLTQKI